MQIKIRLFAGIAEATGKREHIIHIENNSQVKILIDSLIKDFPHAAELIRKSFVSINHDYADQEQIIRENDEVALIPPVSGGEERQQPLYEITRDKLSADKIIAKVSNPVAGAILTFVGTVREFTNGKRTTLLEYEAYPEMAVKKLEEIAAEIMDKWPNTKVAMSHRIGRLDIEEIAVIIAVASPHREAGFEAGRYAIERLKEIVPIWKKELWEDGEEWIGHQKGPWRPLKDDNNG